MNGKKYLKRLAELDPEVSQIVEQVQVFTAIVRQLKGEKELDQWLEVVEQSGASELQSFVKGLRKDYPAVKAGLSVKWSQGQTEAQVGRLKAIKWQLYGQAGFELLRKRVLYRDQLNPTSNTVEQVEVTLTG